MNILQDKVDQIINTNKVDRAIKDLIELWDNRVGASSCSAFNTLLREKVDHLHLLVHVNTCQKEKK